MYASIYFITFAIESLHVCTNLSIFNLIKYIQCETHANMQICLLRKAEKIQLQKDLL